MKIQPMRLRSPVAQAQMILVGVVGPPSPGQAYTTVVGEVGVGVEARKTEERTHHSAGQTTRLNGKQQKGFVFCKISLCFY